MTKLIPGPHNTLRFLNSAKLSYGKPWIQIYNNTTIDKWYVGDFSSATYHVTVEYDTNQKETFQILVSALPNQANYLIYNRSSIQDAIVTISVQVDHSYVLVIANPNTNFDGAKLVFSVVYSETINSLAAPIVNIPTVNQTAFTSDSGFSSPGFTVDTNGNINITGDFKKNGVSIELGGDTLSNSIIYSSLTTLGNLTSLQVNGGLVTISGSGVNSQINNVSIGTVNPQYGKFTDLIVNDSLTVNSGFVDLSPTLTSNINNISIGGTTPNSGKFTDVTITTTPTSASNATTKSYVDTADAALKLNATALAIALGS